MSRSAGLRENRCRPRDAGALRLVVVVWALGWYDERVPVDVVVDLDVGSLLPPAPVLHTARDVVVVLRTISAVRDVGFVVRDQAGAGRTGDRRRRPPPA